MESVGEEAKKVGEEESDDGDYVRGGEGRREMELGCGRGGEFWSSDPRCGLTLLQPVVSRGWTGWIAIGGRPFLKEIAAQSGAE